jgi:predicted transcriptional regulator
MATDKENVAELLKDLPDNVNFDEIIEAIYVRLKILKGLKDLDEGRFYNHEEIKDLIQKWSK